MVDRSQGWSEGSIDRQATKSLQRLGRQRTKARWETMGASGADSLRDEEQHGVSAAASTVSGRARDRGQLVSGSRRQDRRGLVGHSRLAKAPGWRCQEWVLLCPDPRPKVKSPLSPARLQPPSPIKPSPSPVFAFRASSCLCDRQQK